MQKLIFNFWSLFCLLAIIGCKNNSKTVIKTDAIEFTKEGELNVFTLPKDSLLQNLNIEIAESDYETQTGLMYRDSLEDDQGMLFIFPDVAIHSFYMKNTAIPLDIIFIDSNFKIVSFQKNAKPFDETGLSSQLPIKYVLEVNAGLADQWQLKVGDSISFVRN
ncbi:MAG: DUF192 domain-containing protein [Croceitalea sp.]|nr:DUF192 domain-containing protein [Croceitalea sp.]NNC34961.1 DUF192 domain-containing protein [Croceitalea sp.]